MTDPNGLALVVIDVDALEHLGADRKVVAG
jgi:hypothetical protein